MRSVDDPETSPLIGVLENNRYVEDTRTRIGKMGCEMLRPLDAEMPVDDAEPYYVLAASGLPASIGEQPAIAVDGRKGGQGDRVSPRNCGAIRSGSRHARRRQTGIERSGANRPLGLRRRVADKC